ncbi:hypothetical protein NC652_023918 [Populus alba x Populus x berolinensis]|nr:hypothetical protein NC652_023918 [Populus alba x Populus x berolinensis]
MDQQGDHPVNAWCIRHQAKATAHPLSTKALTLACQPLSLPISWQTPHRLECPRITAMLAFFLPEPLIL